MRERRHRFKVKVVSIVISVFGGGLQKDDFCERIVTEMQKKISMGSESIIQKVLLGLVRSD